MRYAAVAAVALFWAGTVVAGASAPGYSAGQDYVSSLAGRGSSVAGLGIAAIGALGCAHLLAARALAGVLAAPLTVAGLAGLAVAALRTSCPGGAAGCGFTANPHSPDLLQRGHSMAVLAYEVALVATMLVVVARPGPRAARVLSALAAVASVVLLLRTGGVDNGAWQRAWLAINTGWLVALVLSPPGRGCGSPRTTVSWSSG